MKKSIIMVLVLFTGILVAQDIAGTYRATGQRVEYQYYTRPNVHLPSADGAGGTLLQISDSYGIGVVQTVAEIPVRINMIFRFDLI
mgnify:CR=1 FL=1